MESKIKSARLAAGLTQQQLSDWLKIPKRTIENWEGGQRAPAEWAELLIVEKIERDILETSLKKPYGEEIPKKMVPSLSIYPACFCKEKNGYSVFFPDLNWLGTCGDDLEESMAMAIDCLAGYLYDCLKDGTTPPAPSDLSVIQPERYLKELYSDTEFPSYFINLVPVDVESYAKEHFC